MNTACELEIKPQRMLQLWITGIEERVLIALEYWREYRTYFHIGSSWGVSELTVCRIVHWVEDTLMASGLKCQLMIEQATRPIICTFFGKGRRHDFKLFQALGVHFHPQTESLQDKGYQGMQKLHFNSRLPKKKPRGGKLTAQDKAKN